MRVGKSIRSLSEKPFARTFGLRPVRNSLPLPFTSHETPFIAQKDDSTDVFVLLENGDFALVINT
jgi:hypothetical protein